MFLICSASRICSFGYYFDVLILLFCVKCWAIELVSERCIVSLLDRAVEVKPTYILLLLSEIQSPKGQYYNNTTILEHQNNKQKLQIIEALHIRNMQPTLNIINFQTSANVLKCL